MRKLRQSKLMMRFLVFGTLLASLPVLVLSIYAHRDVTSNLQASVQAAQLRVLTDVRQQAEDFVLAADQLLFDFSLLPSTADMLRSTSIRRNFNSFTTIRALKTRMLEMQTFLGQRTGHWTKYSLLNISGGWAQTDAGFYRIDSPLIEPLVAYLTDSSSHMKTAYGTNLDIKDNRVHLIRAIRSGRGTLGYGALSLPLTDLLFTKTPEVNYSVFLVTDVEGAQIYLKTRDYAADGVAKLRRLATQIPQGEPSVSLMQGNLLSTALASGSLPWRFLVLTQLKQLTPRTSMITALVVIITLSVLSVIAFAFLVFTKRMYMPIAALLRQAEGDQETGNNKDEFLTLSNYVGQMQHSLSLLSQVQLDSRNQLARQLMLQLIEGSIARRWAYRRAESLNIHIDGTYLFLFLLELDAEHKHQLAPADGSVSLLLARDLADELFLNKSSNVHEVYEQRLVMIHELHSSDKYDMLEQARSQAEQLVDILTARLRVAAHCVITGPFDSLLSLPEKYGEAVYTVRNRVGLQNESIVFSTAEGLYKRSYDKELYYGILQAVSTRNPAEASRLLTPYFQRIHDSGIPADEEAFERLALTIDLLKDINPAEYPALSPLLDNTTNPAEWIAAHILSLNSAHDKIPLSISDAVVAIIEAEYQTPLSLEYCAEKSGYNASYVSRLFKQQMGVSFKEYLYLFRIRKAQDMLINSDLPIAEISQLLCYSNAQNFIRVFKRVVGVTPGAYRNNAKNGNQTMGNNMLETQA